VLPLGTPGSAASFKIVGENSNDFAGGGVSSAGDVNDDGFDDLIIGASGAGGSAGAAYVVFGADTMPGTIDLDALGTPAARPASR
jgi:hypothetical protein